MTSGWRRARRGATAGAALTVAVSYLPQVYSPVDSGVDPNFRVGTLVVFALTVVFVGVEAVSIARETTYQRSTEGLRFWVIPALVIASALTVAYLAVSVGQWIAFVQLPRVKGGFCELLEHRDVCIKESRGEADVLRDVARCFLYAVVASGIGQELSTRPPSPQGKPRRVKQRARPKRRPGRFT